MIKPFGLFGFGFPGGGNWTRSPGIGAKVVATIKKIKSKNTQSIIGAISISTDFDFLPSFIAGISSPPFSRTEELIVVHLQFAII
jgi:hypothetical protein